MDDIVSLERKNRDLEAQIVVQDEVIKRQGELLEACKTRLGSFHEENIELKRRLDCFIKGTVSPVCETWSGH